MVSKRSLIKVLIVLAIFFGMLGTACLFYELGFKDVAMYIARNMLIVMFLSANTVARQL